MRAAPDGPEASIEPRTSYPVDPARLKQLRGPRTMAELVAGIAGFSSEKYRKIESGKTRSLVGSDLRAIARKLGVPPAALLSPEHPDRTTLPGQREAQGTSVTLTGGQSRSVQHAIERLDDNARIQTLAGPRGVGKSTVAMHVYSDLQKRLGPRARFVSVLDQCQPWELWQALGAGRDADTGKTRAELIESMRNEAEVLVLDVDGVPSTQAIEQIETILGYCGSLRLIAFAERPLELDVELVEPIEPVRLDASMITGADDLGASDAWQLVVNELSRERARALVNGQHLAQLVSLLSLGDGTPRWFVGIGRELREEGPGMLIQRLCSQELSLSVHQNTTWDQRVRRAAEVLAPDHVAWLANLPRRFRVSDVSGLGGLTSAEIDRVLQVATAYWLIDQDGERFTITRMAQLACVTRDVAVYRRMVDALIARLPGPDDPPALTAFDVHGHIAALHLAVEHASDRQLPELATRIIDLLVPACMRPTRWQDVSAMAATLDRRLVDIDEISSVPIARWAATGALVTGELDASKYWTDRCLRLATKHVHRAAGLNLRAAWRLSGNAMSRADLDASLKDWMEARQLYEEVDDTISVQTMDANIAHVHESFGDLDTAIEITDQWTSIQGILRVQFAITRARVLARMGSLREATEIVEAIQDEDSLANPMCSIAFCTLLAFIALARDGVPIPASRLHEPPEDPQPIDHPLAAECLAQSRLIATLEGMDPGLLDRIDWAWAESTLRQAPVNGLGTTINVADLTGFVLDVVP